MRFVDEIEFVVSSGRGGAGCISFRREAHVPRGGPDGGDGGRGGDLVIRASSKKNTLVDFFRNRVYKARNGEPGRGRQMTGKSGPPLVLDVPVGTLVFDAGTDDVLADLVEEGDEWRIEGGRGGLGNVHFKSSTRRTPRRATDGGDATEMRVRLELKLIADVGLLGFPNAGKSTFISRVSRSKAKVADYPFTTLVPNLGVVPVGDEDAFVIADIPGLIQGASEGAGLGHQFLRHVERCALYIHLLAPDDLDGTPAERFHQLNEELRLYDNDLLRRPQVVVVTKVDLIDAQMRTEIEEEFASVGVKLHWISSVSGQGITALLHEVYEQVQRLRLDLSPPLHGGDLD